MRIPRLFTLTAVMAIFIPSAAAAAWRSGAVNIQSQPTCGLPESDADALVILNNYYPTRYWWDHTDLTIAVQPHPRATAVQIDAVRDAIATWSDVLNQCFDGLITLTDVTGTSRNPQRAADIVVHFVPTAGGAVFGGFAVCGTQNCPNILVRSDLPRPLASTRTARSTSSWSPCTRSATRSVWGTRRTWKNQPHGIRLGGYIRARPIAVRHRSARVRVCLGD